MVNIITDLAKYVMIILLAVYTLLGFRLVRKPQEEKRAALWTQDFLLFALQFTGNAVLFLNTENEELLYFYGMQLLAFLIFLLLQRIVYPRSDKLLNHNLLLLLSVGLLMLSRLSFDRAQRQFQIAVLAGGLTFLIPWIIRKAGRLRELYWVYGAGGLLTLIAVLILGNTAFGARLSLTIYDVTIQPSEFVKILFVFFVAGMLYETQDLKRVAITTCAAAAHVLVLVLSRDLGGALIFFVTYLVMLYVADEAAPVFSGGPGSRMRGGICGMAPVFPCPGKGAGLEQPFCGDRRGRVSDRPVSLCHRHGRLVRYGAGAGYAK